MSIGYQSEIIERISAAMAGCVPEDAQDAIIDAVILSLTRPEVPAWDDAEISRHGAIHNGACGAGGGSHLLRPSVLDDVIDTLYATMDGRVTVDDCGETVRIHDDPCEDPASLCDVLLSYDWHNITDLLIDDRGTVIGGIITLACSCPVITIEIGTAPFRAYCLIRITADYSPERVVWESEDDVELYDALCEALREACR